MVWANSELCFYAKTQTALVFALAPLRIEDVLKQMVTIPAEPRQIGLIAVALGFGLVALARRFGG